MEIERSINHIVLQKNELLVLIQNAFPDCFHLKEWEILSGGAQNSNYKIKVANEEFVLRLYARNRIHCKIEKEIHNLIESVVPTSKLIYADENNEPWAYSILQFINGIHISNVSKNLKNRVSYELGKTLALIHSFNFKQAGLFENGLELGQVFEVRSSPYFEETFRILSSGGYAKKRLGQKLSDEVLDFSLQNKTFFPNIDNNICLTHSDFKPANLLYNKNGRLFVLDWEFSHAGVGILDFAILLRHRNQFPLKLKALKNGYLENGGILPDEWLRSAMITDFVNIVTMMEAPAERPKLFKDLKWSLETTMRYWNSLSLLFL